MPEEHDVLDEKGLWLFVAPVQGLKLTEDVNFEHRVCQVTFVTASRMASRRRRLGFPLPLSKIRHIRFMKELYAAEDTVAVMRLGGQGRIAQSKFQSTVRDELAILALSQLGARRRRSSSALTLARGVSREVTSFFMMNTDGEQRSQSNAVQGKVGSLHLTAEWVRYHKQKFYFDLLQILRGEVKVSRGWKTQLRTAAILAGQSQMETNLPIALLWNWIVLELLLTGNGAKLSDSIVDRAGAFLDWHNDWQKDCYPNKISEIYQKRNKLVHGGLRERIEISDVLFTDSLIFNIMLNIIKHPQIFHSKDAVSEFATKVAAEKTLGVDVGTRPKTFSFCDLSDQGEDD